MIIQMISDNAGITTHNSEDFHNRENHEPNSLNRKTHIQILIVKYQNNKYKEKSW